MDLGHTLFHSRNCSLQWIVVCHRTALQLLKRVPKNHQKNGHYRFFFFFNSLLLMVPGAPCGNNSPSPSRPTYATRSHWLRYLGTAGFTFPVRLTSVMNPAVLYQLTFKAVSNLNWARHLLLFHWIVKSLPIGLDIQGFIGYQEACRWWTKLTTTMWFHRWQMCGVHYVVNVKLLLKILFMLALGIVIR